MRAAVCAECLDHRNAADEFDRRAVDASKASDEGLHIGAAGPHGAAQEQEEAGKRQQRDDRKAPIHGEQVEHGNQDRAARASHRGVEVRGQAVQGGDVVLHGLLDLARGAAGEPPQRNPRQPVRDSQAQLGSEPVVGQVGEQLTGQDQRHAGQQAYGAGDGDPPDFIPRRRCRGVLAQGELRDMRDARQRRERQHRADGGAEGGESQACADGSQQQADRAGFLGRGRSRIARAHAKNKASE